MIKIFESKEEASKVIAQAMLETLASENAPLFCLAAGETFALTCGLFVKECGSDIEKARFVGLDEWVGVGACDKGGCRYMMERDLFSKLNLRNEQIQFFDGKSDNLDGERQKADSFLLSQVISLAILGVGQNGHIGFNEPGAPFSETSLIVPLADKTLEVGQKYFDAPVPSKFGITLGLGQIVKSNRVIVAAFGAQKSVIVKSLLRGDSQTPAGKLLSYAHIDFYFDKDAAE